MWIIRQYRKNKTNEFYYDKELVIGLVDNQFESSKSLQYLRVNN